MKTILLLTAAVIAAIPLTTAPAAAQDKPVIALSNSFYGNTWRRQMVDAFTAQAEKAKADGLIADFVVLNGDGSVAQQNSQLAELILRGVDAIAINAASDSALNDIVTRACDAGIKVVAFDSLLSADCAWKLGFDFTGYKTAQAEATLDLIGDKGNVLVVRGVSGSRPDAEMYAAQKAVLDANPDVKIVAEVIGEATASVAQQAIANILPSLPPIDAVLGQGGSDDFGIARAFEQYGGPYAEKMPVIEGGGSSDFVIWWNELTKKQPDYETTSMNTTPGIGGAAFWFAYDITQGAEPAEDDQHARRRRRRRQPRRHRQGSRARLHHQPELRPRMGHRAPDQGRQLTALPDPTTTGARSPGAFLTLDGIEKRYGATHANRAVSLSIAPGEVIGLIGANGAGKSTLMRILTGITSPDAGSFRARRGHPRPRRLRPARGAGARHPHRPPGALAVPEPHRGRELLPRSP